MNKFLRRSLVFSTTMLAFSSMVALAASTSSSATAPPSYETFMPPAKGGTYTDAAFGTSVKRLSDAMNMTDNAGSGGLTTVSTEYSTDDVREPQALLEDREVPEERPKDGEDDDGADTSAAGFLGAPAGDDAAKYFAHNRFSCFGRPCWSWTSSP